MKIEFNTKRKSTDEITVRPRFGKNTGKSSASQPGTKLAELTFHIQKTESVLQISLGRKAESTPSRIRNVGGIVAQALRERGIRRATLDPSDFSDPSHDDLVSFLEGMKLGNYTFDRHKTTATRNQLVFAVPASAVNASVRKRIAQAMAVCEATNTARSLGHEPPNIINPVTLAAYCKKMAKAWGLGCKVLDDKQLTRMKANGIVQVGIGSKTRSRLIILTYPGRTGSPKSRSQSTRAKSTKSQPVALVGKAITFDTGGYSLKDKNGIVGMKYDKCGGMAVIGAMHAVATAGCRTPVIGVIAAAENMISGEAYRPNDIITMLNGKTVEIISTDAEGRMVLADALTYTEREYKPRLMIDLATLTGGVVVALGNQRAGIMSNDDALTRKLLEAGEAVNEKLWQLPLDDEYLELIRGDDSDLKNSGGRAAHAIIGGTFLKQFVNEGTPWAHLDIAGMGDVEKDTPICPKGATGFGVRLIYEFLSNL
ncbi:MAG: leucyl aminopeptidase family protein [Phycisphaerae bacterium]